jgi:hypothetical protein
MSIYTLPLVFRDAQYVQYVGLDKDPPLPSWVLSLKESPWSNRKHTQYIMWAKRLAVAREAGRLSGPTHARTLRYACTLRT